MASRLILAALCAVLAAGCAAGSGTPEPRPPQSTPVGVDIASPQASLSPQVRDAAAAVSASVETAGFRLVPAQGYRPSEPPEISGVPRGLFRVFLPDPDEGHVVIYEFLDPGAAAERGRAFAAYLGSPFGQTNYPLDAQFALSQLGGTLIFTWWSPERASSRDRSRAAFEAVSRVGQPIPVVK